MNQQTKQVMVVAMDTPLPNQIFEQIALFNPDGTPYELTNVDGSEVPLTGYSIAGAAAAVLATDTVNDAIGKVEKRVTLLEAHDTSAEMLITGFVTGTDVSALATTDTLNEALAKLQNRIAALEP